MTSIEWLIVLITVLSGVASLALAARQDGSAASYRIADRLAQIAIVGASVMMWLLGKS